uniref:Kinesin-II 85 kDa subunit isoform X1 n=1 Tax=Rhizophora mucronata TaxID=61149 RepID=A0A2P2M326_RHIMU
MHSVRFSAASNSIGKDGSVDAFHRSLDYRFGSNFIYLLSRSMGAKYSIKCMSCCWIVFIPNNLIPVGVPDDLISSLVLPLAQWPKTNGHGYTISIPRPVHRFSN